jgi:hypothetical protein
MDDLDNNESVKSHSEIIHMVDEIRKFELDEENLEIEEEKETNKTDIIEVEHKIIEHETETIDETEKNKFFDQLRNIHFTTHPEGEKEKVEKMIIPATFDVGFNKNGELVNLDFKKKIKKEKSSFNIKNLIKRKKGKDTSEEKTDEKEDSSRFGKIKSKFGAISKITKIIPKRSKSQEEVKTEEKEE